MSPLSCANNCYYWCDLCLQVTTAEEEKSRMAGLQQATSDLEAQLQRAQSEATKRHDQLMQMETGQMDVMKRLALAEKGLGEKEKTLEEMEQKLIQASLNGSDWEPPTYFTLKCHPGSGVD